MIRGDRPSGYFGTGDGSGIRIEGETRQCSHCQYTWQHRPGSGRRYGVCLSCGGLTCARAECRADQQARKESVFISEGKTHDCIPFDEWNYILMERAARAEARIGGKFGTDLRMTESGIVVPNKQ